MYDACDRRLNKTVTRKMIMMMRMTTMKMTMTRRRRKNQRRRKKRNLKMNRLHPQRRSHR